MVQYKDLKEGMRVWRGGMMFLYPLFDWRGYYNTQPIHEVVISKINGTKLTLTTTSNYSSETFYAIPETYGTEAIFSLFETKEEATKAWNESLNQGKQMAYKDYDEIVENLKKFLIKKDTLGN